MSHPHKSGEQRQQELRDRPRHFVVPDTVRNSTLLYRELLDEHRRFSLTQRLGIVVFCVLFVGTGALGLWFYFLPLREGGWLAIALGVVALLLSAVLLWGVATWIVGRARARR